MAGHMSRILRTRPVVALAIRGLSTTQVNNVKHYPVVVLGGGSGGCSMASRLCRILGDGNVAVVEPAKDHLYQPLFTLVGAGIRNVHESERPMSQVLPKQCVHIQQKVVEFDPEASQVTLKNGEVLSYRHLVIALGIQIDTKQVDGLYEALQLDPMVCTNYWRATVAKTFPALKAFKGGNAIFTYPNTPVKCAGAAQKIMYLADEYWRKSGVRSRSNITYKTAQEVIFQVKKYADELNKIVDKKSITVDYMKNLTAIDHTKKEATFAKLNSPNAETEVVKYDFIHITPPMCGPEVMRNSKSPIVDATGYLDLDKYNLQHVKYPNIFGIGDCTNLPTSKTAAAVSSQSRILVRTIKELMKDQKPSGKYDGYTSCPLLTGYGKCILAEFNYDKEPIETFPLDQSKESWVMFQMKNRFFPHLYWNGLVTGHWNGPKYYRKMLHLGMSK